MVQNFISKTELQGMINRRKDSFTGAMGVLLWLLGIFVLAILIPAITVAARRLHDVNKSGWYQALPLPPGIIETIFAMNRNEVGEIIFLILGIVAYIYLIILL